MSDDQPGIDRRAQFDLFGEPAEPRERLRYGLASTRTFVAPDPREIYLGQMRLDAHLQQAGLKRPRIIGELLDGQDWSAFEARYAPHGRAPYAPRCMLGLILYGVMQGVTSLRDLEQLARADLGCMWVSGGILPDHANIGRFITLHGDALSGTFFEQLTRQVLAATGADSRRLAGDGTVIEAACSHYRLLRLTPSGRYRGSERAPGFVRYATAACAGCALRSRCTRSAQGRQIKRYAGDKAKDALREVMAHPQAQQIFRRRQAMVEPVFSVLRRAQGFDRFRPRGRAGVRREFALHILAYNLSRAVALGVPASLAYRLYALLRAYLRGACDRIATIPHPPASADAPLTPA